MANPNTFPEIISITLYKYNSIDSKLYTLIKNNCKNKAHKGTIVVKAADINNILHAYFKDELDKISIISTKSLHKEATSIYFLNKMFNEMTNLRWFQITFSKNVSFSRIEYGAENRTIDFNFKVIRGSFRTFDIFKIEELEDVNQVLKDVGCIRSLQYSLVKLDSLARHLEKRSVTSNDQNTQGVCARMLAYFDNWIEDNPEALIVTDYLDI
jgi:hypothetical protein